MEHAEALERIELAAVEPDGLDRLMAGDTPDAAAVAGHVAGCPSCSAELVRIRRTASIARGVLEAEPDPALRERTLAFVRAVGRDRATASGAQTGLAAEPAPLPEGDGAVDPAPAGRANPARSRRRIALLAAAAAIVIAVGIGYAAGRSAGQRELDASAAQVAILEDTAATAMRIWAQPDTTMVALTPTEPGSAAAGSIAFSATTGDLVATATELDAPGSSDRYTCWVEVAGERRRLGPMLWAGGLWTWAGPVEGLGDLPPDAVFGVSQVSGEGGVGVPVLAGKAE